MSRRLLVALPSLTGLFAVPEDHGRVGPPWGSSVVQLGEASSFHFLINGDWGCGIDDDGVSLPCPYSHEGGMCCHGGNFGQLNVAAAMAYDAAARPVDFIINAGDAMYWYGVEDLSDPRFNNSFTKVYAAPSLQKPWFGVLGNHDWKKNASALVTNYLNWRIPDLSYMLQGSVDGVPVTFFFIDTNYVERKDVCTDRNRSLWGGRHLTAQEFDDCKEELREVFEKSLEWLENSLGETEGHKIVIAHEPVYGAGRYHFTSKQSANEKLLEQRLAPLLKQYGVRTYINAHDHLLQHLYVDGTDYYIIGAGGAYLDDKPMDFEGSRDSVVHSGDGTSYGYGRAVVNSTHLCMRFFDAIAGASYETHHHCRALDMQSVMSQEDSGTVVLLSLPCLCLVCIFVIGLAALHSRYTKEGEVPEEFALLHLQEEDRSEEFDSDPQE